MVHAVKIVDGGRAIETDPDPHAMIPEDRTS